MSAIHSGCKRSASGPRSCSWNFALLFCLTAICLACSGGMNACWAQKNRNQKPKPLPIKVNQRESRSQRTALPVAEVNADWKQHVAESAAIIDRLVDENLAHFGVQPNPMSTDEQFVRRIYLDITGTIPTYQQAKTFIDSPSKTKRVRLIDQLLNSPGYASHMFNYFANLLRLVDRPNPAVMGEPYNDWIKQCLRDNKPYDEMVHEMLTAEGKVWDNPAVGYPLRDTGMPLDAVNNTIRVFLGTQIGCAQCHNHPFDKWTQKQFYEMAAFTFGTRYRRPVPQLQELRAEAMQMESMSMMMGGMNQLIRANTSEVWENTQMKLRLPHDYAYNDGKPGEVITPKAIFGETPAVQRGESGRAAFADWLTSKDNPRFAGTIANRLWKRAFGVGQLEPVDDIRDDSRPENARLIRFLVQEMKRLDFNLKEFQRILYNTKAYQREASTKEIADGEQYHFPGPVLRRLTAEQVWDSLLTLAVYEPDTIRRPTTENLANVADLTMASVTARQALAKAKEFDDQYGRGAMQEFRQNVAYKGQLLARASELPLPERPGHFLREFGQGDRELIEGDSTDGTVPQILAMFNGPVTHMMLERGSVIYDNVLRAGKPNDQIGVIFLSILSRRPKSAEKRLAFKEMENAGAAGYGNVIWSLLNTREFLFIQ